MRFCNSGIFIAALLLISAVPAGATPKVHRGPTAPRLFKTRTPSPKPRAATLHGIDSDRATQIQAALIKSGYLTGTPSGVWDAQSESAMQKLQGDNGWQTKLVPDARALIRLGLGPNSPSATASAATSVETPDGVTAGSAAASAVSK